MTGHCLFCQTHYKKRERKRKFCSLKCANRYNRNGINPVELPKLCEELAEFIGICLGDGCVWGYQTSITLNAFADQLYIPYVEKTAKNLFPGATVSRIRRNDNAIDIRITSKRVADFMKENGIISHAKLIPDWILSHARYSNACIRGLFDTEGSISFKRYVSREGVRVYKQLNFRNTNASIMTFVRDNLLSLGLKPTLTLEKSLYLSNDQSIATYRSLIGFSNPKLLKRSMVSDIDTYNSLTPDLI